MTERIIVAGSGGQGVLTLGLFIARVGILERKNVTFLPSYGAEKRGGFSFCSIVVSDQEIYSPIIDTPDTLILFDQRALESYRSKISEQTLVILNSSLIGEQPINSNHKIRVPATTIANKNAFLKAMNIVIAGSYLAVKSMFKLETAINVLSTMLVNKSKEIQEKNLKAFKQGLAYVKEKISDFSECPDIMVKSY